MFFSEKNKEIQRGLNFGKYSYLCYVKCDMAEKTLC